MQPTPANPTPIPPTRTATRTPFPIESDYGQNVQLPALFEEQGALAEAALPFRIRLKRMFTRFVMALYVPGIMKGMAKTFSWMFRPTTTLQYPEERHVPRKGYRGEHRLKKDEEGRPKCVACFMCQTACPAECITIVAGEAPWPDRDKVAVSFDIDMLKCIYCGMCEEACPCDAIELTQTYTQVSTTRAEKIYDIERLLRN